MKCLYHFLVSSQIGLNHQPRILQFCVSLAMRLGLCLWLSQENRRGQTISVPLWQTYLTPLRCCSRILRLVLCKYGPFALAMPPRSSSFCIGSWSFDTHPLNDLMCRKQGENKQAGVYSS